MCSQPYWCSAVQAGQEAEAVSLYEKAVNVSPRKAEAPDSTDSAPQSYTEPLTFRRNGIYRIRCYAMNQCGEAGEPTELNFTIQLDPEKYHMNSLYQGKDGGWYYNNDAGEPVIGWRLIDNNWYYFADNGRMKTGWMARITT